AKLRPQLTPQYIGIIHLLRQRYNRMANSGLEDVGSNNYPPSCLRHPLLRDLKIAIFGVLHSLGDTREGNGRVASIQSRSRRNVLVERAVGEAALRDEAALEVAVLVVHDILENLVITLDGELLEDFDIVGALLEVVDCLV